VPPRSLTQRRRIVIVIVIRNQQEREREIDHLNGSKLLLVLRSVTAMKPMQNRSERMELLLEKEREEEKNHKWNERVEELVAWPNWRREKEGNADVAGRVLYLNTWRARHSHTSTAFVKTPTHGLGWVVCASQTRGPYSLPAYGHLFKWLFDIFFFILPIFIFFFLFLFFKK